MNIYAVNTNKKELKELKGILDDLCPDADISCFDGPLSSLASAREEGAPDIAFLKTDMSELSGMDLGTYFKEINPMVNIILLADNKDKAYDALKMRVSGYLIKPLSGQDIEDEIHNLRYPRQASSKNRVYLCTYEYRIT